MSLTILMYHYVRDLPRTRYPRINGLLTEDFIGQLDYIQRYYTVCNTQQIINAVLQKEALPSNACLLTFDDGYIDHFQTVFPILESRGLIGSFFVPASVVEQKSVLPINKVHFILTSTEDHSQLSKYILQRIDAFRGNYAIPENTQLYSTFSHMSRWDRPDTAFVKKVLQDGLPQQVSKIIVEDLFLEFVDVDERVLATELYMNMNQLQTMVRAGMEVGGHGFSHQAMQFLSSPEQVKEVRQSVEFLGAVYGTSLDDWVFTYPSGSYNQETISLLKEAGCSLAMSTNVGLADLDKPLELMRLNTNDLPFIKDSKPNSWTVKALSKGA